MSIRVFVLSAGLAILGGGSAAAQNIIVTLHSDPAGVSLIGDGSDKGEMQLNTVRKHGGTLPFGLTRTITDANWTLSSPFGLKVEAEPGLQSSSYTARAQLKNDPLWFTWKVNNITLMKGSFVTITSSGPYNVIRQQTFSVFIPDTAPDNATLDNEIEWLVIAN